MKLEKKARSNQTGTQQRSSTKDESKNDVETPDKKKDRKPRVLHKFLLKKIIDDHEIEGGLLMVGTFVQWVFDLTKKEVKDMVTESKAFFDYRFNEVNAGDDNVHVRRTERITMLEDGETVLGCRTTMEVRIPMEMDSFLCAFPFQVNLATAAIELSSDYAGKSTVRPQLLLHNKDPRYSFALQNKMDKDVEKLLSKLKAPKLVDTMMNWIPGLKKTKVDQVLNVLDKTKNYELLSPYPEVSYRYDPKKEYCARFKVQYYVVIPGFQRLVKILLPMVLVSFIAILNVKNDLCKGNEEADSDAGEETANHLQVTTALTLTIVFVLPLLLDDQGNRDKLFTISNVTIIFFFFGLILASVPRALSVEERGAEQIVGVILMSASALILPLYNSLEYWQLKKAIEANHTDENIFLNQGHDKWTAETGLGDFLTVDRYLVDNPPEIYDADTGDESEKCIWWASSSPKQ